MLATIAKAVGPVGPTPYPFPQDCSNVNASTGAPSWFSGCDSAATPACFKVTIPTEAKFNVGNTTFGASKAGGTKWCIDHLQGFVYSKVVDPAGAMYYEVDDRSGTGEAPQCRFLTGSDGKDASGKQVYHARTYTEAGLTCTLTAKPVVKGVQVYDLAVTEPPKAVTGPVGPTPYPFPQDCSNVNASTGAPSWFSGCDSAATPACFKVTIPTEAKFNVGNTTFGASKAGGTKWCIDHLQGFVYSKVVDPAGAMYYEVDDRSGTGEAPQCRFLTGSDGKDASGKQVYHARTYTEAGLTCTLTAKPVVKGVQVYDLAVTEPPVVEVA